MPGKPVRTENAMPVISVTLLLFEVAGGLIQRQDVWNDLAELRPPVA